MSITAIVRKLIYSEGKAVKTIMSKGFKAKGTLPNSALKQIPEADSFVKTLRELGHKDIKLDFGVKGGKNTVTGRVNAYSGKKYIGYVAGGIDKNGAKPILQLRGSLPTTKTGQPVSFNGILDANKTLKHPLESAVEISMKQGKAVCDMDLGGIKSQVAADVKSVMDISKHYGEGDPVRKLNDIHKGLQDMWANMFPKKT